MKLTFWGAAQQVTGSQFLLEADDYRILIDCGIDMEQKADMAPAYPGSAFPYDATMVNAVLLTHAHIDHSGHIPNLYRDGYEGKVYCTPPTRALSKLLLYDSAFINRKKLNAYNKLKYNKSKKAASRIKVDKIYLEKDVDEALDSFHTVDYGKKIKLTDNITVEFLQTGHLLGAANILVTVYENKTLKKLLFSGDLGRFNYPLLPDPAPVPQADYIICETTYGSRKHQHQDSTTEFIREVIQRTCVDRPGRLIIPAFSIGRTQALLYTMNKLHAQGKLPLIKVFADSPLAYRSNQVFVKHKDFLSEEAQLFMREHGDLFSFDNLTYIEDNKQSKALSNYSEPCIIISSSGMLEGGRIQHHIRNNIQNSYATILMIGYAAEGTMGHRLLNHEGELTVGRETIKVAAQVEHTDAFSGHGDVDDLLHWVKQQDNKKLKKIFLVHGEESSMKDFAHLLAEHEYENIAMPAPGEEAEL